MKTKTNNDECNPIFDFCLEEPNLCALNGYDHCYYRTRTIKRIQKSAKQLHREANWNAAKRSNQRILWNAFAFQCSVFARNAHRATGRARRMGGLNDGSENPKDCALPILQGNQYTKKKNVVWILLSELPRSIPGATYHRNNEGERAMNPQFSLAPRQFIWVDFYSMIII